MHIARSCSRSNFRRTQCCEDLDKPADVVRSHACMMATSLQHCCSEQQLDSLVGGNYSLAGGWSDVDASKVAVFSWLA